MTLTDDKIDELLRKYEDIMSVYFPPGVWQATTQKTVDNLKRLAMREALLKIAEG